jgi:arsenite methyltransferase
MNPFGSGCILLMVNCIPAGTLRDGMGLLIIEIQKRYGELAEQECCLSCGGAINLSGATEGEVCVDLGCGKGTDVIRLREAVGERGFVYGVDISEAMLAKAKKNVDKFFYANVELVRSELEQIAIASSVADLVISNCTLNHARDKRAAWAEIYRILKKGGRFVVSDIYSTENVPAEYANDPVAVAECWAGAITKQEYLAILSESGFKNITIVEESEPYEKGKISVASFTVSGSRSSCNCGS